MQSIEIMRDGSSLVIIKPDEGSTQVKRVMGSNDLNISFKDSRNIVFAINDYCTVFGELYKLNRLPVVKKLSQNYFEYTLTMEAEGFDLSKIQYLFLGADNSLKETDFSLTGDATVFMGLLMQNLNRVYTGWVLGEVIPSGTKTLTFSKQNCYNALGQIAEAFGTEFWIEGKRISLTKKSVDTGYTFQQGRHNGLYNITRLNVDSTDVITRLYAYGSDKNLPPLYDTNRLHMPGRNPGVVQNVTVDHMDDGTNVTLTFHWEAPIATDINAIQIEYMAPGGATWSSSTGGTASPRVLTLPSGAYDIRFRTIGGIYNNATTDIIRVSSSITTPVLTNTFLAYVESNTPKYGIIEGVHLFDDVYPHRTGTITSVDATNIFKFVDFAIDFDINAHLLPGLEPKITFNTGQLAGYTFKISKFDNGTKEFTILKNAEETALDIPNDLLKAAIGDEYVLHDIQMPQSYVDAAEAELQARALLLLAEISVPQVSYTAEFDPVYLKKTKKTLNIGDMVWMKDEQLGLERQIRITQVTRNLVNEYAYEAEFSDVVSVGKIDRLINDQSATIKNVSAVISTLNNNATMNNKIIGTLLFDGMPTTNTQTGFSFVMISHADGKLYRLV